MGVVPRIWQMMDDIPFVNLALSLHAPTQERRLQIVPTAKAWPIDRILEATDAFIQNQNDRLLFKQAPRDSRGQRPPTPPSSSVSPSSQMEAPVPTSNRVQNRRSYNLMEYVLLGPEMNCTEVVAHELGMLLSSSEARKQCTLLNVIPYNPTSAGELYGYTPPPQEVVNRFMEIVRSYGVSVMVRQELGQDVNAACGQLVVNTLGQKGKSMGGCSTDNMRNPVQDMEDLGVKAVGGSGGGKQVAARRPRAKQNTQPSIVAQPVALARHRSSKQDQLWLGLLLLSGLVLMRLLWKVVLEWRSQ